MAGKPSRKRLKVYSTRIGFHEWLVAAPSQKAALEAWDVKKNLFAIGAAKAVTEKKAVDLATKTPGEPVTLDDDGDMAKARRVVRLDDHRKHKAAAHSHARPHPKPKKVPARKPKKADRTKLDRAETALEDFGKRAGRERAAIVRARKALDLESKALEADLEAEEERLHAAAEKARQKYEATQGS